MASVLIEAVVEGTTPLLCNRFTEEAGLSSGPGAVRLNTRDPGTPYEQASHKLYRNNAGDLIIPVPNIFRSVIDGGAFFKAGKNKVTTQKSSLVPACVEVSGLEIPLVHKEPWTVDSRPVRNPSTGGRFLCHRPRFEDWSLSFSMTLDTDLIPLKLLREIVDAAGKRIGLGDFRPACKGPFGRYVVVKWVCDRPEKGNGAVRGSAVGVA